MDKKEFIQLIIDKYHLNECFHDEEEMRTDLDQLISSTIEECAKSAEQITMNGMDKYYDFIKENWEEFKEGQYSDREILSCFIAKTIRDSKC